MKKILEFILLIFLMFTSSACQNNDTSISVIVPNGIPAIAQSYIEYDALEKGYLIDRVSGPSSLVAAFTSQSHDIIIAPINLGANLYNKNSSYKLSAIITWSNLQLISREEINIEEIDGKTIIAFGANAVPEMVINYIFSNINYQIDPTISYQASSAQESFLAFMQNEDSLAIVSEPVTSIAKSEYEDLYVYDLLSYWQEFSDLDDFPQAGVFVNEETDKKEITKYLNELKTSSQNTLSNPSTTASNCEKLEYPFEKTIIETSIPNSHINYLSISDNKELINDFLEMIFDFNKDLIGSKVPDDNFYWE